MAQCPSCGAPNVDGTKFCVNCGSPLEAAPVQPQEAYPEPVQQQVYVQPQPQYDQGQYQQQPYQQQSYQQPYQQPGQPYAPQPAPVNDSGSIGWGVLGFLIPIVGLILFIVWRNTKPKSAKVAGIGAAIGFAITLVYYIAMGILFS